MAQKFLHLMLSLIGLLLIQPFLFKSPLHFGVLLLITTVVILYAVQAASENRRHLAIALLLAVPAIITAWSSMFLNTKLSSMIALLSMMAFFGYTMCIVLLQVLRPMRVTIEHLYGAISVFLMIGLTFGLGYTLLHTLDQVAFRSADPITTPSLIYFSFVTLATIGFGDIIPVTAFARMLSVIEGMLGILYIAILIGRIVGMYSVRGGKR